MEARLAAIEIERCNLRAAMADHELQSAVEKGSFSRECLERRQARRALEKGLQHAIPPGPWDDDLDRYPLGDYTVDLGDGYTGTLRRGASTWTWLCYIRLPAGHCCIGKNYGDLSDRYTFPTELTYGLADTFGFDHGGRYDLAPHYHFAGTREDLYADKGTYTKYEIAQKELKQLKAYFKKLETNRREAILAM